MLKICILINHTIKFFSAKIMLIILLKWCFEDCQENAGFWILLYTNPIFIVIAILWGGLKILKYRKNSVQISEIIET